MPNTCESSEEAIKKRLVVFTHNSLNSAIILPDLTETTLNPSLLVFLVFFRTKFIKLQTLIPRGSITYSVLPRIMQT